MGIAATSREFVRNFINDNCIARVPPGSKELPSYQGKGTGYYIWQFYLRTAYFEPAVLDLVVQDFMFKFDEALKDDLIQLCGVESSSTPLLTGIAIACRNSGYKTNVFSIRKDQKTYGRRNWLEGRVLDNKLTMLVDDIVSETHKTAIHGASILFNQGIPIANTAYATVHKTHTPKNNKIKLLNSEITVRSMFCLNDFDLTLEAYNKKKQRYPWT